MPYTPDHRAATRSRILASAARLFCTSGYEQVSIDEVMEHAGLTRGGFYAHFPNKAELYREAILDGAFNSALNSTKPVDLDNQDWLVSLLEDYLSSAHVAGAMNPCPLAFLATDVANREPGIRGAYTRVYKRMNTQIRRLLGRDERPEREQVLAMTVLMVGGVAVARSLDDPALSKAVLESCRKLAVGMLKAE